MSKLCIVTSQSFDPYLNLAIEKSLLTNAKIDTNYLYLWHNADTVVIGANQNPFVECDLAKMRQDGVKLARRTTGGGAVFHDSNNLNFSFVSSRENFDKSKNFAVICGALKKLGIYSEPTGRNDIFADGKKISGNAFYLGREVCLHHGTLLIACDIGKMSKYLIGGKSKVSSKGVASVKSRVCNLVDLNPMVTTSDVIEALRASFHDVVGGEVVAVADEMKSVEMCRQMFENNNFVYADWSEHRALCELSFDWGVCAIDFAFDKDKIVRALMATDALDTNLADDFADFCVGKTLAELMSAKCENKKIADIIKELNSL